MDLPKYKIGYAENGGIFIGKNIQADFHKHHLIVIALSFTEPFEIFLEGNQSSTYEAALIPKNTLYKLSASNIDYTAFVHLDPYSELGITLVQDEPHIQRLDKNSFVIVLNQIKEWLAESENTSQRIDDLLHSVVSTVINGQLATGKIDERVLRCIRLIRNAEGGTVQLQQMANQVFLSSSRLSHLFKEETGLTFKQFVQHCKLVKSLHAMHDQQSLTEASFLGGFTDQPHFTKTFKKSFGISPSSSKQ
ncbi:MAG: helix-turn-helix transcriptional regulator [Chloroflexi bacterium]|nr:helix-turn-helix transcriptional regulator [Chloroflexota bacterium]